MASSSWTDKGIKQLNLELLLTRLDLLELEELELLEPEELLDLLELDELELLQQLELPSLRLPIIGVPHPADEAPHTSHPGRTAPLAPPEPTCILHTCSPLGSCPSP